MDPVANPYPIRQYRRGAPGTPEYRATRHLPKPRKVWLWLIGALRLRYQPGQPRECTRPEGDMRQVTRQGARRLLKMTPIAHPVAKQHINGRSRWEGHRIRKARRLEAF